MRTGCLDLERCGKDISLELEYWNNTFEIVELRVEGEALILSNGSFFKFKLDLSRDTQNTLHCLRTYIDGVKKYVQPVVNCHRLFLCGDQTYDPNREDWQCDLLEGMSIDEALRLNSSLPDPETVLTWDNLSLIMEKDIDRNAIFVFDLDNLPDYLK